jgi:hypothetical protein
MPSVPRRSTDTFRRPALTALPVSERVQAASVVPSLLTQLDPLQVPGWGIGLWRQS